MVKKKILIITYYWPPAGGPGVQRVVKFVKYLPFYGIQPVVLTVDGGDYPDLDQSLSQEISKIVKVYKVKGWEPYKLYRMFTRQKSDTQIPFGLLNDTKQKSIGKKISNWIRLNLFIPDARKFLIKPFIKKGEVIIKEEKIDLILTSSPPHSIQLIGMHLKRKMKVPWIADLRDPWTTIFHYQNLKRLHFTKLLDKYLEKSVLKESNAFITVSNLIEKQLVSIAPNSISHVIYNGFDDKDFVPKIDNKSQNEKEFKILYYGNLRKNQISTSLLNALSNIKDSREKEKSFKFRLIGNVHDDFKKLVYQNSLGDYIHYYPYMEHNKVIDEGNNADLLVLLIPDVPDNKGILTGKLFEYLRLGKPILGIGPVDGEASMIMQDTNTGKMFNYGDHDGIMNYINGIITGDIKYQPDDISFYSRENQVKKLSEIIMRNIK